MKRPRSLWAHLALLLGGGLLLAQALTLAWVFWERTQSMRDTMRAYLAADVASSVAMLDHLPAPARAQWLARLERPHYQFTLGASPSPASESRQSDLADLSAHQSPPLAQADATWAAEVVRALTTSLSPAVQIDRFPHGTNGLRFSTQLSDGQPLTIDLTPPRLRLPPWLLATLVAQWALLAAVCAAAVRQATQPLQHLSAAATQLDPARAQAPAALPDSGPSEVVAASRAFRQMQQRIASHVDERTQMLGAIAHDLQTPITRMRLRADLLADALLRDKLQADLSQMQHLVEQGLAYARTSQATQEPSVRADVSALVHSLVADYQDAGRLVSSSSPPLMSGATLHTRPQALRRVLENLVDNALKFAGEAEVMLTQTPEGLCIHVLDRGPGIPPSALDAVTQPFFRLDRARGKDTGGAGLGLAIVQSLTPACGATLAMGPRNGGGLEVKLLFR